MWRQGAVERGNSHKTGASDRAYIWLSQSVAMRAEESVLVHRKTGKAREIVMDPMSRRNLLAVTAGGSLAAAAVQAHAQSFGNPDLPPQGAINAKNNPASITDPGPQNPAIAGQFPSPQSPPATDVGSMPLPWASFNNASDRLPNAGRGPHATNGDFAIS